MSQRDVDIGGREGGFYSREVMLDDLVWVFLALQHGTCSSLNGSADTKRVSGTLSRLEMVVISRWGTRKRRGAHAAARRVQRSFGPQRARALIS